MRVFRKTELEIEESKKDLQVSVMQLPELELNMLSVTERKRVETIVCVEVPDKAEEELDKDALDVFKNGWT